MVKNIPHASVLHLLFHMFMLMACAHAAALFVARSLSHLRRILDASKFNQADVRKLLPKAYTCTYTYTYTFNTCTYTYTYAYTYT